MHQRTKCSLMQRDLYFFPLPNAGRLRLLGRPLGSRWRCTLWLQGANARAAVRTFRGHTTRQRAHQDNSSDDSGHGSHSHLHDAFRLHFVADGLIAYKPQIRV